MQYLKVLIFCLGSFIADVINKNGTALPQSVMMPPLEKEGVESGAEPPTLICLSVIFKMKPPSFFQLYIYTCIMFIILKVEDIFFTLY